MKTRTLFSGGGYILTQGFHQSKLSASAIDEIPTPGLVLAVYPNPSNHVLNLRIDEGDYSDLRYSLLSIDGKTLISRQVKSKLTEIDMLVYASGNYLLRVTKKTGDPVSNPDVVATDGLNS